MADEASQGNRDTRDRERTRGVTYFVAVLILALASVVWWTGSVFSTGGWWPLDKQMAWRFTPRWAALVALVIVVVVLLGLHWICPAIVARS